MKCKKLYLTVFHSLLTFAIFSQTKPSKWSFEFDVGVNALYFLDQDSYSDLNWVGTGYSERKVDQSQNRFGWQANANLSYQLFDPFYLSSGLGLTKTQSVINRKVYSEFSFLVFGSTTFESQEIIEQNDLSLNIPLFLQIQIKWKNDQNTRHNILFEGGFIAGLPISKTSLYDYQDTDGVLYKSTNLNLLTGIRPVIGIGYVAHKNFSIKLRSSEFSRKIYSDSKYKVHLIHVLLGYYF